MEWVPIIFIIFKGTILFIGMFFAIKWHYDQDKKDVDESNGPQSPTEMRLFATMIVALALSVIGIVYAGCWGNAADGGYGGALGCAFTVLMFIVFRPDAGAGLTGRRGQNDVLEEPEPTTLSEGLDQLARLKLQTQQLHADCVLRLESAEREKIYLGIAGIISMLAWKFGDVAAAWLKF